MLRGRAWKFGDDVNTDIIIPAKYLNTSDPKVLARHCFEGVDPGFSMKVKKGDIVIAGKNFGCGSSREHAPIALKAAGISCIVARSFARIFYRNSFNMGLLILESREAADAIGQGHEVEVDPGAGIIKDKTSGRVFKAKPIPGFMQELVRKGGLMKYIIRRVRHGKGSKI